MKAFLTAVVAAALISVGAYYGLTTLGYGSAEVFSSENVRLG
jgi:hypothetical protein